MRTDGLALSRAQLYGKPHIGDCDYPSSRARNGRLGHEAMCAICGRKATNAHHIVPKGMGGGSSVLWASDGGEGIYLRSPLIAVCGIGNASGCHKLFHDGLITVEWEWDDPRYEEAWWDGTLLSEFKPHQTGLYGLGSYLIHTPDGEVRFRG